MPQGPEPGGARAAMMRRRRIVAGAGAAVVVVAAAVTAGVVMTGDDPSGKPDKKAGPAPSSWVQQAARQLTARPGLQYAGTLPADGRPVQARLRVTRAGSATGTLTAAGGMRADVVTADGVTYLKAGPAFWRTYGGEGARPDVYAGRWTKAPASMPGLDVADVLGPEKIAERLAKAPARPRTENVAGVPAYRVKTQDADYFLTTAAPYRLVSVQAAGQGDPRFAVAPVTAAAPLFAELRPRVAALGGAADPALRFAPGKLTFVNCDENMNGCTVSVPAKMTAPDGTVPSGARAALRATVTSKGKALGTCTGTGAVPSNRELVLRCTVTGRTWRNWMRQALDSPGAHPYEAQARVVGEAVSAADVSGLLAGIDRERGVAKGAGGKNAPGAPKP
ncbi:MULTISPECIES: hypothetical protein [Thermomonosporaceae]|uniref:hypothetical protein n=1 Tax=Thermomonosporaceae TaxID=2012 RepID=UPI00255A7CD3|nr:MULTISPECIES: hypothetical protein [Thermomonosporaceae]MDL4777619.1 hypothetical protein [Actinomadura xylanilytica]